MSLDRMVIYLSGFLLSRQRSAAQRVVLDSPGLDPEPVSFVLLLGRRRRRGRRAETRNRKNNFGMAPERDQEVHVWNMFIIYLLKVRWQYLSQMKNVSILLMKTFSWDLKNATGYFPGSVMPSTADGAPLSASFCSPTVITLYQRRRVYSKTNCPNKFYTDLHHF